MEAQGRAGSKPCRWLPQVQHRTDREQLKTWDCFPTPIWLCVGASRFGRVWLNSQERRARHGASWGTGPHLISSGDCFSPYNIRPPCDPFWSCVVGVSVNGSVALGCISLWKLLWHLFSFVGQTAILSPKRSVVTPFCLSWHVWFKTRRN